MNILQSVRPGVISFEGNVFCALDGFLHKKYHLFSLSHSLIVFIRAGILHKRGWRNCEHLREMKSTRLFINCRNRYFK